MKLETFDEVHKHLYVKKNWSIHLLFGNGFSMAYNYKIFSYKALSRLVENSDNMTLQQLFSITRNKNFEVIMQQLDVFAQLAEALDFDKKSIEKIKKANEALQKALVEAVKELHPEHVFKVSEEESKKCFEFLQQFLKREGQIFTTNYDLLLYWVLMRNKDEEDSTLVDGFGRYAENIDDDYISEDEIEWSRLTCGKHKEKQNIHYLHGALPLFDNGIDIIKEEYDGCEYLLDKINDNIRKQVYPVFVTAGDGNDKLKQIMHNKYLSYCYEALTSIQGSLLAFGFNFGEYDKHIIDAINIAAKQGRKVTDKLWSVYIGVYSDDDKKHIESIESQFKCKVHIYDAKTVKIWRD
jgi:predicted house-cleaning noncanonical NTP pyrophosphatase (MazG superfamily)